MKPVIKNKGGRPKGSRNKPKVKPVIKKTVSPVKSNVQETINKKLSEIKTATTTATTDVPKGNELEQKMKAAEQAETTTTEQGAVQPETQTAAEPQPEKNKGGRPKGSRNKSTRQAQEEAEPGGKKIDQIMIYEEVALMGLCARFNKRFDDVKLTEPEKELLLSLQPETEFLNKPSWPNYIATNLALILIKWFNAPTIEKETKATEAETDAGVSRQNSPEENLQIIHGVDLNGITEAEQV